MDMLKKGQSCNTHNMFCELLQSWNIHFGLALCLHNNLCHDRLFLPLPLSSTPWPLSTHNLLLSNPYRTQKPYKQLWLNRPYMFLFSPIPN